VASRVAGPALVIAGVVFGAFSVGLAIRTAVLRVRQDSMDRKLHRYGCPRCGYEVHSQDLTGKASYPCPTCSEPIYE